MDFTNQVVTVELDDETCRGLQDASTFPATTDMEDGSPSPSFRFHLQGISSGSISPYEDGSVFCLQSVESAAFLGINYSDRTVMLANDQFPPPESFRFRFDHNRSSYGPWSLEVPCAICPVDQKPVKDAKEINISLDLVIRAIDTPSEEITVIDDRYTQQLGVLAALQEAQAVNHYTARSENARDPSATAANDAGLAADDDPPEQSYLENADLLKMVSEIKDTPQFNKSMSMLGLSYSRNCM